MQLTERHIINLNHSLYKECDRLCFASKNIYNRSLYLIKQDWENNQSYDVLNNLYEFIKQEECYTYLPPKVSQQTIRLVQKTYKAFFASLKSKNVDHKVGEPKYLNKTRGRMVTTYTIQAISKKVFQKAHKIKLSQCDIEFSTGVEFNDIACVRIVPSLDSYVIEVVYNVSEVDKLKSNRQYAAIDLGVNNLAVVVSNKKGFVPKIVNGHPLKSVNQYYNKKMAFLRSKMDRHKSKCKSSHRLKRLVNKRNNKVNDYLHKASRHIVDMLVREDIRCLIVGHNLGWKDSVNMRRRNNQNFVNIPHSRFISMLKYKCELVGIEFRENEEAHTSKCSFLDMESIEHHDKYVGRRVKRGLFKSKDGLRINADVNGAYNILRKAVPTCFRNGIEGVLVYPESITVSK